MKKRLLCLVFTLLMVLSSTQALAAKREHGAGAEGGNFEAKNILESFGSFDKPDDIKYMTDTKAIIDWAEDSAVGKGGSLQVKVNGDFGSATVAVPVVLGETYDITFYARCDEAKTLEFIPLTQDGWDSSILVDKFTPEWKKYSCSYYCDGTYRNTPVGTNIIKLFNTRCGNGTELLTYYLDELSVVPRGDVEYDWSTFKPVNSSARVDVIPADTGFATPKPEMQANFSDTNGHWAEKNIELLTGSGYVQGMGDGTYAPEKNVTRAEFVTMAMNLFSIEKSSYKDLYSDVKANQWFANTVQTANEIHLIDKMLTIGGKFKPDQAITREEAASIISKLAKIKKDNPDGAAGSFLDEAEIAKWAKAAVKNATAYGIINGYPDGTFGPKKSITRAEAATMLFRIVELSSRFAFYVDGENGDDNNDGTQQAPLKTINAAREKVQSSLKDMEHHIYVFVKEGTYKLDDPVNFGVEDSGQNGYSVIYTSWGDEKPVFSGGEEYSGFELYDENKNIYRTYIGEGTVARQVYINGVRGVRARTVSDYSDADYVLNDGYRNADEGWYSSSDVEYVNFKNKGDIEFVYYEAWTNPRVSVKDIVLTEDGKAKFILEPEEWKARAASGQTGWSWPVFIENAYELLDLPGEWYLDRTDGYLYYMPREYEDPDTMVATVPYKELGFVVAGNSADEKVHNIKFRNLSFKYFTWLWPEYSEIGYQDNQGNNLAYYPGDGRITGFKEDAPMIILDAAHIDVTDSEFTKLGGAGINCRGVFQNMNVVGNHIYDLSSSGMNAGIQSEDIKDFNKSVLPEDYKNFKIFNTFDNNYIHDVGIEYSSSPGINSSFLKKTTMDHNEVYNTGYAGWHNGWGWDGYSTTGTRDFSISYNYIHDIFTNESWDAGAIYTLGTTGGTDDNLNQMTHNYVERVNKGNGALYPDEGSTYWEVAHNVVDMRGVMWYEKNKLNSVPVGWLLINNKFANISTNYVHDNYATVESYRTSYKMDEKKIEQAHVYPDANWPEEAQKIVDEAGLEEEYLKKFPDEVQRLELAHKEKRLFIQSGESVNLGVEACTRKGKIVPISDDAYQYYSSDEDILTIDEHGVITGVASGKATVYVEYLEGDIIKRKHMEVICDDAVESVDLNASAINMILGSRTVIRAQATTKHGNIRDLIAESFTVDDPSVVTVTPSGEVSSVNAGSTVIHTVWNVDGEIYKMDISVSIISYLQEDTESLVAQSRKLTAGDAFFEASNWTQDVIPGANGSIGVKGAPAYYMTKIENELISFDVSVDSDNGGWPSFILSSQDPKQGYGATDLYFIGVKPTEIEFQRFNSGKRTMVFGDSAYNPVGGPGIPNTFGDGDRLFAYDTTYSVTLGTMDVENGTRIIFAVNDKPLFDYVDVANGYIKNGGYFGIQEGKGRFWLSPYTGITYPKAEETAE